MNDLAAMHYLVERIESDRLSVARRAAWQAAATLGPRMPIIVAAGPDPGRPLVLHEAEADEIRRNARGDLVRILDREGNVVWWREFQMRDAGVRKHTEIMDDLMRLDPAAFRSKYRIIPERPAGVPAPATEPGEPPAETAGGEPAAAPAPPPDPWGAWRDRLRTNEGGSSWTPPEEKRPSEPDIGWGDWGQR